MIYRLFKEFPIFQWATFSVWNIFLFFWQNNKLVVYLHLGKILNEQVPIWNGQKGTRILTKKSAFEYMPVTDSCPISANLNKQITLVSNSNYFLKIPRSSTCRLTVFCWLLSLVNRLYAVIHKMQKSKEPIFFFFFFHCHSHSHNAYQQCLHSSSVQSYRINIAKTLWLWLRLWLWQKNKVQAPSKDLPCVMVGEHFFNEVCFIIVDKWEYHFQK